MYSLNKATSLLLESEKNGTGNTKSSEIISYNSHKIRHTFGVLEVGRNIITKLRKQIDISDETVNKAEICFILHDLGRFFQNNGERVLKNDEFEHGDKSREIALENNYGNDIYLAVKYHNKYSIEGIFLEDLYKSMKDLEKQETIFLAKILRDADKLQNMLYSIFDIKYLSKIDICSKGLKDDDISKENIVAIKNKKSIDRKMIRSFGDYVLSDLSLVFDINFKQTIEILKFYGYFDKIYNLIETNSGISSKNKEIIKTAVNEILNK